MKVHNVLTECRILLVSIHILILVLSSPLVSRVDLILYYVHDIHTDFMLYSSRIHNTMVWSTEWNFIIIMWKGEQGVGLDTMGELD